MESRQLTEKSSLSNYACLRVINIDLTRLLVDFDNKVLRGSVNFTVRSLASASELVLDTNHLAIHETRVNGVITDFSLDTLTEPFGQALRIPVPDMPADAELSVTVEYSTTSESSALQWLTPEQTAGKKHPYMFTQCQAIHARSLLPCQDTPLIKAPYTATGYRSFRFTQRVPIPSYLIALAVGNLESRGIGPRSKVYAEPEVVDAAAWEFAETESFIKTGEELLGPYVWGRYDILMLPPSFPYGGMENPCLTFVTPTLIAGDRSLADVVAHEIAHSWTGNLVTNATWEHFWLNEGWTMMIQRKIIARLKGDAAFDFDAFSGEITLQDSVRTFMERDQSEFTKLVPSLDGIDPDDAFSSVPYEKGFYLLYYLQSLVGRDAFDRFAHDYIQTFKFRGITSYQFATYFETYFLEGRHTLPRVSHWSVPPIHDGESAASFDADTIQRFLALPVDSTPPAGADAGALQAAKAAGRDLRAEIDWAMWFHGKGMPPVKNEYDGRERESVNAIADLWVDEPEQTLVADHKAAVAGWDTAHWLAFMERMVSRSTGLRQQEPPATMAPSLLRAIDKAYSLSRSRNSEIRCQWGILCIRSGVEEMLPAVVDFLKSQGRMKYVRPLFRELLRTVAGRPLALRVYEEHGQAYHPICCKMVGVDIERETAQPAVNPGALRVVGDVSQPFDELDKAKAVSNSVDVAEEVPATGDDASKQSLSETIDLQAINDLLTGGQDSALLSAVLEQLAEEASRSSFAAGENESLRHDAETLRSAWEEMISRVDENGESKNGHDPIAAGVPSAELVTPQAGDATGNNTDSDDSGKESSGQNASKRAARPFTVRKAKERAAARKQTKRLSDAGLRPVDDTSTAKMVPVASRSTPSQADMEAKKLQIMEAASSSATDHSDFDAGGSRYRNSVISSGGTLLVERLKSVKVSDSFAAVIATTAAVVAVGAAAVGIIYFLKKVS